MLSSGCPISHFQRCLNGFFGCVLPALFSYLFSYQCEAATLEISLATLPDYSPFCFIKEGQKADIEEIIPPGKDSEALQGYSWDVVRESYHAQGYTIKLNVRPWSRAFKSVKEGSIDALFPAGKNKERETFFGFSEEPVNLVQFLVYFNHDQDVEWTGLESLAGKKVGAMSGYNYGDAWNRANIKTYDVVTLKQGFDLLRLKRIAGFVGYEIPWDYYLKTNQLTKLFKKSKPFDESLEYIAVSRKHPKSYELLKAYDTGLDKIKKSGRMNIILSKWR